MNDTEKIVKQLFLFPLNRAGVFGRMLNAICKVLNDSEV